MNDIDREEERVVSAVIGKLGEVIAVHLIASYVMYEHSISDLIDFVYEGEICLEKKDASMTITCAHNDYSLTSSHPAHLDLKIVEKAYSNEYVEYVEVKTRCESSYLRSLYEMGRKFKLNGYCYDSLRLVMEKISDPSSPVSYFFFIPIFLKVFRDYIRDMVEDIYHSFEDILRYVILEKRYDYRFFNYRNVYLYRAKDFQFLEILSWRDGFKIRHDFELLKERLRGD